MLRNSLRACALASLLISALLLTAAGQQDRKASQTASQPDKILYDRAVKDIEHGRYEVARLSLNTLMNTYESSEYLSKAQLALAESWFKEGGARGLEHAQEECKQLIQNFPGSEEARKSADLLRKIQDSTGKKPSPAK